MLHGIIQWFGIFNAKKSLKVQNTNWETFNDPSINVIGVYVYVPLN